MARYASFAVLVGILLLLGALFYHVMIRFALPLFMAVVLVVIFAPVHRWLVARCGGYDRLAAGLATLLIVFVCLVPVALVTTMASLEAVSLYHRLKNEEARIDLNAVAERLAAAAGRLGFEVDAARLVAAAETALTSAVQDWLAPLVVGTTQYLGQTLLGVIVLIIALYYFLADGPAMIRAVMHLSPLDEKYETELVEQFGRLSRAVVVAIIASAVVQGMLAAAAFWVIGFDSVFLMMLLTVVLAMVPFVGAAAVWVPACLWLLAEERFGAAIGLAVYGAAVVSTADNVIKPMVLRGQSNLHPLLALLSVLGGVMALGPIGIFVGPMAVVFLQTLLNMFHAEVASMSGGNGDTGKPTAHAPTEMTAEPPAADGPLPSGGVPGDAPLADSHPTGANLPTQTAAPAQPVLSDPDARTSRRPGRRRKRR